MSALASVLLAAELVTIPAGPFLMGSEPAEREYGYRLDEQAGSTAARYYDWFSVETRKLVELPAFAIDRTPVSQTQYRQFVQASARRAPQVDRATWDGYGLVHPYETAQRYIWHGQQPPPGKADHPVVLVDAGDAEAYCHWRGLSLPTEAQWEKAARGDDGRYFPWGNEFDPKRLNSRDDGPGGTEPVGSRPSGASPYGVLDMAGQVFEWTATACPGDPTRRIVKGGAWDDYPGVTRAAARHCRPVGLKHVLLGFRCVANETNPAAGRSSQ